MRRTVLTIIILLAFPATSSANPLLDRALTTPDMTIIRGNCPDASPHSVWGCIDNPEEGRRIWIAPTNKWVPYKATLAHEAGHAFDFYILGDAGRTKIVRIMNWTRWMRERFANSFGACVVNERVRTHAPYYGLYLGRRWPKLCNVLPKLGGVE